MTRMLLTATAALFIATQSLSAGVVETGSTRFIIVMNQGGEVIDGPTQLDYSDTLGLFDEYLQSSAWNEFHGGSSEALQDSNVSNGVYDVHLSVGTDAGGGTMGTDIALGYAEAYFEVLFTLDETTDFNISGTYNAFGEINGAVSEVELRIDSLGGGSPSQVIAYETDECCPSINFDGTLLPGDYAFRAHVLGIVDHSFMTSYNTSTSGTNVTMTLDIPMDMPADMDCSGTVDLMDVAPFVQALLAPADYDVAYPNCDKNLADINSDGQRDGGDVSHFASCVVSSNCP